MARPLRIQYPGAFYHVMNRGAARTPIFLDPLDDRTLFLNVLAAATRLWKIRVHAYSLMSNHYHLLIETPLGNLSRAMRHIDGIYTQSVNRKYHRDGPLFRGRFKSILVQKESYFLELVRYIHLNGVRAQLYRSALSDADCSHPAYVGRVDRPEWLHTDLTLSFFSKDSVAAQYELDQFVSAGIPDNLMKTLSAPKWPAILGADDFIRRIKQTFQLARPANIEKPQERSLARATAFPADKILRRVGEVFGCEPHLLNRRDRQQTMARKAAIYLLRYASHLSYREIGVLMRLGDSGVHRHIKNQLPETQEWRELKSEFLT